MARDRDAEMMKRVRREAPKKFPPTGTPSFSLQEMTQPERFKRTQRTIQPSSDTIARK